MPFPAIAPTARYAVRFADAAHPRLDRLAPNERREFERLPSDARRGDWLAGRRAARDAVAAHCGVAVERILLEQRIGAAPRCMVRAHDDQWTPLPVSLSIAHCNGVAIASAGDVSTRVAVDVERTGEITSEHHRYFLAESERTTTLGIDPTLLWVLKEAAWKALGLDSAFPFTALRLDFAPQTIELRGVDVAGRWQPARASVMRFARGHEFVAAALELMGDPQ